MTTPQDTQPHRRPPVQPPAETPAPSTQPHERPVVPPVELSGRVGGDVVVGDYEKNIRVERDYVGRDVVNTTNTTNVGFSAAAVQRLLITVGIMVFLTAACFFSGGLILGGATFAALDREVDSDDALAAVQFAELLQTISSLPPGVSVTLNFTEQQLSAYFRQYVAPTLPLDITEAKLRLLDDGDLVVGGRAGTLGGAQFAATFEWQDEPGAPLRLDAAAVEVLPLDNNAFGWVAVPTFLLEPLTGGINDLFGGIRVTELEPETGSPDQWNVTAIGQ